MPAAPHLGSAAALFAEASMIVFQTAADLRRHLDRVTRPVGFVPTMGALHRGHTSLLARARDEGLLSVVSIFVNPTQFNDLEDFRKYPTSLDADMALLMEGKCDVLFLPSVEEVYPKGFSEAESFSFGPLDAVFEGAHRPGHFRGVGQVVARLLHIVRPAVLFLGQKDYQQCLVLRDLVRQLGWEKELRVSICPTVREEDGLAMSSRNRRLSAAERAVAGALYQCLLTVRERAGKASLAAVRAQCETALRARGIEPEYLALAEAETLSPLNDYTPGKETVALIAARIGALRLIDNLLLA